MDSNMSDKSLSLLEIFQEILAASGNGTNDNINQSQILTALREHTEGSDLQSVLAKVVENAKSKLNLSLKSDSCAYCDGEFRSVIEAYNSIHGYVSLLVCTVGILANMLNVAVLTRRDLAAAPINRLLKWLAVADIFVMMEYMPFAVYKHLVLPRLDFPFSWAVYLLFHMHFAQILHTASICLTLSLAIWRYIAIKYSDRSHILCTERRCSIAILSSFILPPLLCTPSFLVFHIHTDNVTDSFGHPSGVAYYIDSDYQGMLYQANFWVHAVAIKLLPCSILTVISVWLIKALYSANQHQKNLKNYSACPSADKKNIRRQHKADKRTDRTTKMLLAVLLLFLVTELPQGILGLMSGLLGRCFFKRCYGLFGELMDFLALLNGAINFVLYCTMSRQFRQTFRSLVLGQRMTRILPPAVSHSESHNQNT